LGAKHQSTFWGGGPKKRKTPRRYENRRREEVIFNLRTGHDMQNVLRGSENPTTQRTTKKQGVEITRQQELPPAQSGKDW